MNRRTTSSTQNRSEQVRQRRTVRSHDRVERASRSVSAPTRVTVRGMGIGQPVIQRTSTHPRRVYPVAFQPAGKSVFIPAPSLRLSWRALSGVLVIGSIALLIFFFNSSMFQVIRPTIVGASRVSVNDIEAVLKLTGVSIFSINPIQELTDLTQAFPELTGATIQVGLPNTVAIRFGERQPILAWKQKNQTRWVDAEGAIFAARGDAPANLKMVVSEDNPPIFRPSPTPGPVPTPTATAAPGSAPVVVPTQKPAEERFDLGILSEALTLSSRLPEKANLVYAINGGLGWHDPRGWDVFFGRTLDDLQQKISMYEAIISQLTQKGIKPKYINLEYLHAPYYRLER